MKVIPALDLLDGNVVRLKKGDYNEVTIFDGGPTGFAKKFHEAGFNHIHLVDLNGAREGRFVNLSQIRDIILETGLSVQVGGGIRTFAHCEELFEAGITQIVCSSMAVKNEKDWLKALTKFGGERCILGMDLKDGRMAYSGWLETMEEPINDYLSRMLKNGLQTVLCTDISRDGMLSGVNTELYRSLMRDFPELQFIASGGVAGVNDLKELSEADIYGVVVGRAYLEGHITLEEMTQF